GQPAAHRHLCVSRGRIAKAREAPALAARADRETRTVARARGWHGDSRRARQGAATRRREHRRGPRTCRTRAHAASMTHVSLAALNIYPVKSCRGIALQSARVAETGLVDDRHWMMVRPNGRFVTQRELPRLALVGTAVASDSLTLTVSREAPGESLAITVWKFNGGGIDCGETAAAWCTRYLETPLRLVRFDTTQPRECNREWTRDTRAVTEFSDGYPVLVISRAS